MLISLVFVNIKPQNTIKSILSENQVITKVNFKKNIIFTKTLTHAGQQRKSSHTACYK
jgi:hypothetical protein